MTTPKVQQGNPLFNGSTFTIDAKHLDIEWTRQSSLCFEACRCASDAQLTLADLKRQLEVEKAQAEIAIRSDPANYGFTTKPTESAISARVLLIPAVQSLMSEIIKAKHQYELCNAAVTSLEHKKKGLESLVQLCSMNYYSAK